MGHIMDLSQPVTYGTYNGHMGHIMVDLAENSLATTKRNKSSRQEKRDFNIGTGITIVDDNDKRIQWIK